MAVFRGFIAADIVACYEEAPGGGDIFDINAPRNAPAKFPFAHLDKLSWHSDFFHYEVAAGPVDVPVNHAALAGKTTTWSLPAGGNWIGVPAPNSISFVTQGDSRETSIAIFAHGLGVIPKFIVSLNGRRVPDGYMVQLAGGNYRRVSVFADETHIWLRESAVSGAAGDPLPAVTLTYRVMVFSARGKDPAKPLFGRSGNVVSIARGLIKTTERYLRRTGAGDTPFALNLDKTMDIRNGGGRTGSGGIAVSEPRYNGTMPAPPFISVGVD